jgi:nucleotide-binding universal stress UspA family protein
VRHVLCAVDINSELNPQVEGAAAVAREFRAGLTLVHVVPGPETGPVRYLDNEFRRDRMKEAETRLKAIAENCSVPAGVLVDDGHVPKCLARAAHAENADLIVIGRSHHSGLGRLRTHGYAIIRESPCAVLGF